jgi:peptide deformylase
MAIRDLIYLPDTKLRLTSTPFEKVNQQTRKLADDMLETMYDAPGIGLAGIQIGEAKRIFVIDMSKDELARDPHIFINPQIISVSEEQKIHEEGCLSIPDFFAEVTRPESLTLSYLDMDGKPHETLFDGLFATCIQHELDHLNGILFIDYLSRLKRTRVLTKFTKLAKERD